ncbi:poly-beta-1,6-N-acetyl-D-glucosamine biosynthesis protein PgaD [Peribacillus alkalitolerans]|uniref:poly-beta-1,6-N-acetyl-D-glucosamine biosynthesis protein PgaD n=1 Tax=Peribacillus alkalitolerans TaxID=1550385 RepID=UPI003B849DE2
MGCFQLVIKQKRNRKKFIFESVITSLAWIFIVYFVYLLFSYVEFDFNVRFYKLSLSNIDAIIIFTFSFVIFAFLSFFFWGEYNKKRFGSLNRRSFPKPLEIEEIAAFYSIRPEEVHTLQGQRYVER